MFFTPNPPRAKTVKESVREEIDDTLLSDEENLGDEIGRVSSVREAAHSDRERRALKELLAKKGAQDNAAHKESRPLPKGFSHPAVADAPVFNQKYRVDCSGSDGALCGCLSPQLNLFAVGCRDGSIRLIRNSGDELDSLYVNSAPEVTATAATTRRAAGRDDAPPASTASPFRGPVTALSWKPECHNGTTSNILLGCDSQGTLSLIHATTGTVIRSASETDNQILAAAYLMDGRRFLTAGTDETIRVYDDGTGRLEQTLRYVGEGTVGHASRVTCLHEMEESKLIVSGSWDSSLHFWDLREGAGRPVNSMHGIFIGGGDAIDSYGSTIATATMASKHCLQLWDVRSPGQLLTTYPTASSGTTLYCTRFLDNQRLVCAGSGTDGSHHGDAITGAETKGHQGSGSLQVLDIASGRNLTEYTCSSKSPIFSVSIRVDPKDQTQVIGIASSRSAECLSVI